MRERVRDILLHARTYHLFYELSTQRHVSDMKAVVFLRKISIWVLLQFTSYSTYINWRRKDIYGYSHGPHGCWDREFDVKRWDALFYKQLYNVGFLLGLSTSFILYVLMTKLLALWPYKSYTWQAAFSISVCLTPLITNKDKQNKKLHFLTKKLKHKMVMLVYLNL